MLLIVHPQKSPHILCEKDKQILSRVINMRGH